MSQRDKILVSVIIATYKRPESLQLVLNSISACTVDSGFDYEVIVADNNSLDDTKNVVKELMPKFNGRLKYVFEPKQGKNIALNRAIAHSTGTYIAMTDDDCLVEKDWLFHIVETMEKHKVDILCGKIIPLFSSQMPSWIDLKINVFQGPLVYVDLGDRYIEASEKDMSPTGANMVITREAYLQFGINEQRTRAQDSEIGYSWKKRGAVIGYSPDVIVYHQTPDSRLNKKYFRQWQFLCGKNVAIIDSEYYKNSKRMFLKVPLWVYKKLLNSIIRYLKGIFTSKNNFANEMWVWYHLGQVNGLQNINSGAEQDLR